MKAKKGDDNNTITGETLWKFVKLYTELIKIERTRHFQQQNFEEATKFNVEIGNETLNKFKEQLEAKETNVDIDWLMYNLYGLHERKCFEDLEEADETLKDLKELNIGVPLFVQGCYNEIETRDGYIKRFFAEKYYQWKEDKINDYETNLNEKLTTYSYNKQSKKDFLNGLLNDKINEVKTLEKESETKYGVYVDQLYKAGAFVGTADSLNSIFFHGEIKTGGWQRFHDIFFLISHYTDKHNEIGTIIKMIRQIDIVEKKPIDRIKGESGKINGKLRSEEIRKIFENEFERAKVPFSDIVEKDNSFKDELFNQFCYAEEKPCFDLYLADFYSEEELNKGIIEIHKQIPVSNSKELVAANYVAPTPFESRINQLFDEFATKTAKNNLPLKYYCPNLERTPITQALREIEEEYELLKKSVFDETTNKYKEAEIRAKNVSAISEKFKDFSFEVLEHLQQDNENIYLYIKNANDEKVELWKNLKSNFNSSLKSMRKKQSSNTKSKKTHDVKEFAVIELVEIAVSMLEPERSSKFNKILTIVKDEIVQANIKLVKKRIDEAVIMVSGFTSSEIDYYQRIFGMDFYFILHSPNFTTYIEDKIRELHFRIKDLELDLKTKQYEFSEDRDLDKGDLIETERYKVYLENLLLHFSQNGASKNLLNTAKNLRDGFPYSEKIGEKEPAAPVVRRFCELANDSNLLERGFDETAEDYCKRVCSKYNLRFRIRVSKYFTTNNTPKGNDINLRKVIERILPNIPDTDQSQILTYINNNTKLYG